MKKMFGEIQRFVREEDGVTAIEYGLLAAVVALVIAVGAATLGSDLSDLFSGIGKKLSGYTPT